MCCFAVHCVRNTFLFVLLGPAGFLRRQDVIYASETGNKVAWIRNLNGTAFATEEFVIASQQQGPSRAIGYDVDHDGDAVRWLERERRGRERQTEGAREGVGRTRE